MRLKRGRGQRSSSRFGASNLIPILKIAGLAVAAAGLVLLIIFVIVPLFGGGSKPEPTPTPTVAPTATPVPTPIAKANMSEGSEELTINYNSINDPYVFGREVVFSTGAAEESAPDLNKIAIYNLDTKATQEVEGITLINANIFEPKLNANFIVYLDCKNEDGGSVCAYNRETKESFVMREYLFGKPKVSLAGNYALWMQQTGAGTDKLYLYDLTTKETTVIEELVDPNSVRFSPSSAYMSEDAIVFVEPRDETKAPANSSASTESELRIIPLKEDGDQQSVLYLPGVDTYVYDPMIDGDNIVFLNGPRDMNSNLMLCTKTGDTYSAPVLIAEGALNYCVGDGYVAYTSKDSTIMIYYFKDGSSGQLSKDGTKGMLSSAGGKDVVWYDITDIESASVVIHLQVP
jgi:hypothetical protein